MIKSLIVDDEPRAIKALEILLEKNCPEVRIIGTASNVDDAYRQIVLEKPALVFLDINMPNGTGLDLIERIKDTESAKVIFTTAHDEFAIKAFRLSAIDYLLKPIDKVELIDSINRFKKHVSKSANEELTVLSQLLDKQNGKRIAINTVDGVHVINLEDVLYLSSEKNYTTFHFQGSSILTSKPLGDYEKTLSEYQFIRVHRSYIVNLKKVKEFHRKRMEIVLDNECCIEVSRNRKELLMENLKIV
ncbi:MAG: LytTR family DNA-binding domain-containing protein [Ekhidna sp.]